MFSKSCEYAIRACIFIAEQSLLDKKVSLKEVAEAIESPIAYTSKILQKLSQNQIIVSEKGPTGGFFMDKKKLDKIKLSAVVFTIDGDKIYNNCGLGLKDCNEIMPCPVHVQFKKVRENLKKMLETTNLLTLAMEYKNGTSFLKQ